MTSSPSTLPQPSHDLESTGDIRRDRSKFRQRSRDKAKWIKPEKFNGHGSFETFLVQFENCASYNRWSQAVMCKIL